MLIVSFILSPFLFSQTAKRPGGAKGTAPRTGPGTAILVTGPGPKWSGGQSSSGIVRRIFGPYSPTPNEWRRLFVCWTGFRDEFFVCNK